MLFNEMDADGDGALDASALDDSPYCQVAWSDDLESSDACGEKLIKEIDNNGDGKVHFTLTPTLTLALTLALTLTLTLADEPPEGGDPERKLRIEYFDEAVFKDLRLLSDMCLSI